MLLTGQLVDRRLKTYTGKRPTYGKSARNSVKRNVVPSTNVGVINTLLIETRVSAVKPVPVSVMMDVAASSAKFGGRMLVKVSGCATVLKVATNSGNTLSTLTVIVGLVPDTLPDQPRNCAVVNGLRVAVSAVPKAV